MEGKRSGRSQSENGAGSRLNRPLTAAPTYTFHQLRNIVRTPYILYCLPQSTLTVFIRLAFYRAACNADAVLWWDFCLSVCLSVRLSVRPSVTRVICDKTVERSVQIFKPYERTFILVFWEVEWLVGGDPFYVKFWVNRPPLERNRRFTTNNRS